MRRFFFFWRIPQHQKECCPMPSSELSHDLLTGADAIAAHLGPPWNKRKIYWAAENKYLPIGRIGKILTARKSELDRATSAALGNPQAA
jgi:hypothetical protein